MQSCEQCEKLILGQQTFIEIMQLNFKQMEVYKDHYKYTVKENKDYNKVIISLGYMAFFGIVTQFKDFISIIWVRPIILLLTLSLFVFIINEIIEMRYRGGENKDLSELIKLQDPKMFQEKHIQYQDSVNNDIYNQCMRDSYFFVFWSTTIWGLSAALIFIINLIIKL